MKAMKKTLSIMLTCAMLITSNIYASLPCDENCVHSESEHTSESISAEKITTDDTTASVALSVESLSSEVSFAAMIMGKVATDVSTWSVLYTPSDEPLYLLVEFTGGGYIILMRGVNGPLECSYTSQSNPYAEVGAAQKYYLGALSYGYASGGNIISCQTGDVLSEEGVVLSNDFVEQLKARLGYDDAVQLAPQAGRRLGTAG